ncbi:condensation domain-containing protein [Actinocrispum sp. NPDC049592]|uniref:condensation domain-containing protein n=1 Tax=Actinocrispum sp. NPDC049592 TaxID=3154835 RepID=UPI003430DD91
MKHLEVDFAGHRAGSGPVTLGQGNVLEWIGEQEQERSDILCRFVPVPPGRGLADIRASVAVLLARHESLRTTIQPGPPATQHVIGSGTLVADVRELAEEDAESVLRERIMATRFNFGRDLPFRVSIATRDGVPYLVALALSHLAADYTSMQLLAGQFAAMLDDPAARIAGPAVPQPLDVAAQEAEPPARRRAASALRYWDTQLRRLPQSMFAMPTQGQPGSREAYFGSRKAGLALPATVERTGVSHSTVLLAMAATLLAVRAGTSAAAVVSMCGNRFRPDMAAYVGTVAQDALIPFDLGDSTVDDTIRAVRLATMNSYRYGKFDAKGLWPILDAIATNRGTRFHRDCVVNDVSATMEDRTVLSDEGQDSSRFVWLPQTFYPVACLFTVLSAGSHLQVALYGDTRYLPEADIEGVLRGLEALVVASAAGPVPISEVSAITGVVAVERGEGWVQHEYGWVELAAVRRLLADVLPGAASGVFFVDGELVAYLAPEEPVSPKQLHNDCVAALYGRYSTITPGRYVICAGAPEALDSHTAWMDRPVVYSGTGRD